MIGFFRWLWGAIMGQDGRQPAARSYFPARREPTFYSYANRDRLVRKFGARTANMLERMIISGEIKFTDALDYME